MTVATSEKIARRARLIARGTSGHGSVPRLDNPVVHRGAAQKRLTLVILSSLRNPASLANMGALTPTMPSSKSAVCREKLPDVVLKLSPLYAWGVMSFGAIMFVIGLLFLSPDAQGRNVTAGALISIASAAAVTGGNYWRKHMPVMARMTSHQLHLPGMWPRKIVVNWTDIVALEKKTLTVRYRGAHTKDFIGIKLKNPIPPSDPLSQASPFYRRFNEVLTKGLNQAILGRFDLAIDPLSQFGRTPDWFIAECQKRINAACQAQI